MVNRVPGRLIHGPCVGLVTGALCIVTLGACRTAGESRPGRVEPAFAIGVLYVPAEQPFDISLVPEVPVPIRLGTSLGFQLSSGSAGYASLYLIDPADEVWVLAENWPLPAGNLTYPTPAQGFTLSASEPLGVNRVILLVTREPFDGFAGGGTLTRAVSLAVPGSTFVARLNRATRALSPSDWAVDEITVSIVA